MQNDPRFEELGKELVDPSVFAWDRGIRWVGEQLEGGRELFVPSSFLDVLGDSTTQQFFGLSRANLNRIAVTAERLVPFSGRLESGEVTNLDGEIVAEIRSVAAPPVASILAEEYEFLISRSTVVSRLKRPFDRLWRAGASFVQVATRKTVGLPANHPISRRQYRKAGIKWIAVGGSAATSLAIPLIGVPLNIAADLFLLLDP